MFTRLLPLPRAPDVSFFLWGPRQTGKSWLLRTTYPQAIYRDLLKTDLHLRYLQRPYLLREELRTAEPGQLIILDEVQKVPSLLDEVHWLIENRGLVFGLCGSSARKVRRGHANLLGGRALRYELHGLVSAEIGPDFDLRRMVNHGYLPRHYVSAEAPRLLRSYVNDYLKEEIAAEGLVRNLPAFANFLTAASLSDTEVVNFTNIARECSVSSPTVKEYFQILVDTLLGRFLPAYVKRPKRRPVHAPKFFCADVGVVNSLARRGWLEPGSELFGKAFEAWLFHELISYSHYSGKEFPISYWRLTTGTEVDFILNDMEIAVEVKASSTIMPHHLRGLRELKREYPKVRRRLLVCLESIPRQTDDRVEIMPASDFVGLLWEHGIV